MGANILPFNLIRQLCMCTDNPYFLFTGGLFDMTDTVQEIAFRYAVDRVNVNRDILPRSRLTAQIERIPQQDSFYASKQGMYRVVKYKPGENKGIFHTFMLAVRYALIQIHEGHFTSTFDH